MAPKGAPQVSAEPARFVTSKTMHRRKAVQQPATAVD